MAETAIRTRLTALMAEERPMSTRSYGPDDVFDTLGLLTDLRGIVDALSDKEFEEAAMERLEMEEFFCSDCGETPGGTIEMCPEHLTEAVESMKVWGE